MTDPTTWNFTWYYEHQLLAPNSNFWFRATTWIPQDEFYQGPPTMDKFKMIFYVYFFNIISPLFSPKFKSLHVNVPSNWFRCLRINQAGVCSHSWHLLWSFFSSYIILRGEWFCLCDGKGGRICKLVECLLNCRNSINKFLQDVMLLHGIFCIKRALTTLTFLFYQYYFIKNVTVILTTFGKLVWLLQN